MLDSSLKLEGHEIADTNPSFSTENTTVARLFAAMYMATISTVYTMGMTNAERAQTYAESFKIIHAAIGEAIRGN